MTLQEQAIEYKELAELVFTALKSNYSSGSVVGYTSNGTKVTYSSQKEMMESLLNYRRLSAHANAQIAQLKFLGY